MIHDYFGSEDRKRILGSGERRAWLRVDDLIREKANIAPDMVCVDLGCGAGAVSLPLSLELSEQGKVFAVDRDKDLLDSINAKEPPSNLVTIQNDVAHSGLDSGIADVCFMVLILHEVPAKDVIAEAYRILKPGGKAVILEWRTDVESSRPPLNERIGKETMEELLADAGFTRPDTEDWTESHYVMTAVK